MLSDGAVEIRARQHIQLHVIRLLMTLAPPRSLAPTCAAICLPCRDARLGLQLAWRRDLSPLGSYPSPAPAFRRRIWRVAFHRGGQELLAGAFDFWNSQKYGLF